MMRISSFRECLMDDELPSMSHPDFAPTAVVHFLISMRLICMGASDAI